jgi:hypothetical protein
MALDFDGSPLEQIGFPANADLISKARDKTFKMGGKKKKIWDNPYNPPPPPRRPIDTLLANGQPSLQEDTSPGKYTFAYNCISRSLKIIGCYLQ